MSLPLSDTHSLPLTLYYISHYFLILSFLYLLQSPKAFFTSLPFTLLSFLLSQTLSLPPSFKTLFSLLLSNTSLRRLFLHQTHLFFISNSFNPFPHSRITFLSFKPFIICLYSLKLIFFRLLLLQTFSFCTSYKLKPRLSRAIYSHKEDKGKIKRFKVDIFFSNFRNFYFNMKAEYGKTEIKNRYQK